MYGFIAAELAIVLVKSYLLVSLAGLFFAFGASDITRTMTVQYLKTIVGIGLQLMALYFLISVGQNLGQDWVQLTSQAAEQHDLMPMMVILASVIIYYLMVKNIPTFIAGLSGVGGFRNYGDAAVGMAVNAGLQGARLVTQGQQVFGKGVQAAGQLAHSTAQSWQAGQQGWQQGSSSFNKMKQASKVLTSTLAHSALQTSKDAIMRQNSHLSMGQKFNRHMANQVEKNKENE